MGLVDLHCHLLWAVDDGVETPEESVAGARLLASLGFTDVAPSPHAHPDAPSHDVALCDARRAELTVLLEQEGVKVALHRNAENRLDEAFLARAAGEGRRGIGATQRWALVELPFRAGVPALPDLVFRLRRLGVLPLFAHPERCVEFERPGAAEEVVRLGGALQLNAAALIGLYGKTARKVAERLLGEGLYAVAATDLHHAEGADEWIPEALDALEKQGGADAVDRLFDRNPHRVLAGEELA
ncbi:MAG TPA: CpsB/CapC family capsule biosynthesis tyrosine phosphatase [Anaeromyxobacteraceae bacterium]|nr:CpsB/CapC family capsule biosynthesis tyrosine phosphatase [Anaeromyxobacteraceae bacterium]